MKISFFSSSETKIIIRIKIILIFIFNTSQVSTSIIIFLYKQNK